MSTIKKVILKLNTFKYSLILALSIIFLFGGIALFFPAIQNIMLYLNVVFFAFCCCVFNIENSLCILLFVYSFEILDFSNSSITFYNILCSVFTFVFGIKYLISVIKKKNKIFIGPLILSIILIFYGLINFNSANIFYYFAEVVLIAIIYICFVYSSSLNKNKLINFLICGFITSIIISCFLLFFDETKSIVIGVEDRFKGLCRHTNTFQLLCLMNISFILYKYFKNQLVPFSFYSLISFFVIFGFLTKSKAFIICLLILIFIYFTLEFKRNKKLAFNSFVVFISLIGVGSLVFKNEIAEYLNRFISYGYDNIFDKILTGRFTIWKSYLGYWASSAITIIFGCGVTHAQPFELGAHSGYVDTIFTYGILGCIILIALIFAYAKEVKYKKQRFKFANCIPLILFLILSLEEYLLSSARLILILSCLVLFEKNNLNKEKNEFNSNEN